MAQSLEATEQHDLGESNTEVKDPIIELIKHACGQLGLGRDNIPSGEVSDALLDLQQSLILERDLGTLASSAVLQSLPSPEMAEVSEPLPVSV